MQDLIRWYWSQERTSPLRCQKRLNFLYEAWIPIRPFCFDTCSSSSTTRLTSFDPFDPVRPRLMAESSASPSWELFWHLFDDCGYSFEALGAVMMPVRPHGTRGEAFWSLRWSGPWQRDHEAWETQDYHIKELWYDLEGGGKSCGDGLLYLSRNLSKGKTKWETYQ